MMVIYALVRLFRVPTTPAGLFINVPVPENQADICIRQEKLHKQLKYRASSRKDKPVRCCRGRAKMSVTVGQSVLIRIPDVDRGRAAPKNVSI
ncbi:unnamed protein product [Callosobruchus maculatus]|uniref:Uncharacterized protein n=1 Tax=Callosobruchus maculatus TaxID=64391 RepID=A0A653BKS9_CALMS|nr:unnamed protein product [Callosobruchus maculatus]